jgi:hypothetical protein
MFLPYYLPDSTLLRSRSYGITALLLWVLDQVRPPMIRETSQLITLGCLAPTGIPIGVRWAINLSPGTLGFEHHVLQRQHLHSRYHHRRRQIKRSNLTENRQEQNLIVR